MHTLSVTWTLVQTSPLDNLIRYVPVGRLHVVSSSIWSRALVCRSKRYQDLRLNSWFPTCRSLQAVSHTSSLTLIYTLHEELACIQCQSPEVDVKSMQNWKFKKNTYSLANFIGFRPAFGPWFLPENDDKLSLNILSKD